MRELLPSTGPLRAVESWGGLIDCTPDALPVIDAPGRPEGLLVATGFSAHGFAVGPVVGRLLAE
jgi:glycine/D-amino acid oxidase-like deaminating enzyme